MCFERSFRAWLVLLGTIFAAASLADEGPLRFHTLAPLPDDVGFAGMFAGVSHEALIVAGGANFPDGRPWDGAKKVWWADAFVLTKPDGAWMRLRDALPGPRAYGAAVTWEDRVICIGGSDTTRCYAEVFALRWDAASQSLHTEQLPPLPMPLANLAAACVGPVVYVAGGQTAPEADQAEKVFFALDLSRPRDQQRWRSLDPWPGPGRILPIAGTQEESFFLFGGADLTRGNSGQVQRKFLDDAYRYQPGNGWKRIADLPRPLAGAPSPAARIGSRNLLIFGGDDGELFDRVGELRDSHPGFPAVAMMYHVVTDRWVQSRADVLAPVTTAAVWWRGRWVVPSGEARPGVRTPQVLAGELTRKPSGFRVFDSVVLLAYLGGMLVIGWWCSRHENSTDDFFLAGRRIPWWAAGLSVFGTQLSAITFLAMPAMAYRTDWVYFLGNLMICCIAPVVVWFYLPFYRRLNVTSAYEYLGLRFNQGLRLLGSALFVSFQVGRMGVVLYLPSLALSTVTGYNIMLCILLMGVIATAYTVMGGIGAVIWTDVVQVIVLLGGAVVSLALIIAGVDGGLGGMVQTGWAEGKFHMVNLTWDVTTTAVWVVVLGRFMDSFTPYTADQTVVQRYLTTKDERSAASAIWVNALLGIPATIIFFAIGTGLWAFYRSHPDLINPSARGDDIFPWFIAQQLPVGVSGLVLAAVFAASMSSLDSSINSMATTITTDFYRRFRPAADDRALLRVGRWLTLMLGALGTALAVYMAMLHTTSMWDMMTRIMGLFGSGLAGLFALGIFTRRAHAAGALIGFFASAACLFYVTHYTSISFFLYAAIGISVCFIVGYAASLLLPGPQRDLSGLTMHTLNRDSADQDDRQTITQPAV